MSHRPPEPNQPRMPVGPPRYQHEHCDQCVYLGRSSRYDLYFCPQNGFPTVIARYGLGHRYVSGMAVALTGFDPWLTEALRRAARKGLVPS